MARVRRGRRGNGSYRVRRGGLAWPAGAVPEAALVVNDPLKGGEKFHDNKQAYDKQAYDKLHIDIVNKSPLW